VTEYTVHPYDPVLGLYYAKARIYDPADRRFAAMDPVKGTVMDPQSLIQYVYVLNNPLKYVDLFDSICFRLLLRVFLVSPPVAKVERLNNRIDRDFAFEDHCISGKKRYGRYL
jgi:RHS repeat-associated protein